MGDEILKVQKEYILLSGFQERAEPPTEDTERTSSWPDFETCTEPLAEWKEETALL